MKKYIMLTSLFALILLSSCKKEGAECPQSPSIIENYTSQMDGKKGAKILAIIDYEETGWDNGCAGFFIRFVNNDPELSGNFSIQIIEGLPTSFQSWTFLQNKEFIVDVEFLGVGYKCVDGQVDVKPNSVAWINVELLKITDIEIAP